MSSDIRKLQFPEIGVLAVVPDPWSQQWMVRHHVMVRLGNYFQVIWVNPARHWREVFNAQGDPVPMEAPPSSGFSVMRSESWLPAFYRPRWLGQFSFHHRLRRAAQLLRSRGCKKVVLYLWHPSFESALSSVSADLSCYHLEDEYSYSPVELPLDPVELRVLASVDQVFMLSPALFEKKGGLNPNTLFVPGGVDFAAHSKVAGEPVDLALIPHPRIGYVGTMKRQLDWPLLKYLVSRHREWSFLFLGPMSSHAGISEDVATLLAQPNVFFLGSKNIAEVPPYLQHFDVCMMPYRNDGYTKFIYPLKLHEYLAAGRPTVGTPIRSLVDFSHVVSLPQTPEEWSTAIEELLQPAANAPRVCAARRATAQKYDWDIVVHRIACAIVERLRSAIVDAQHAEKHMAAGPDKESPPLCAARG
jgi:glycosyltransferase involved in cell wall biosynthesis